MPDIKHVKYDIPLAAGAPSLTSPINNGNDFVVLAFKNQTCIKTRCPKHLTRRDLLNGSIHSNMGTGGPRVNKPDGHTLDVSFRLGNQLLDLRASAACLFRSAASSFVSMKGSGTKLESNTMTERELVGYNTTHAADKSGDDKTPTSLIDNFSLKPDLTVELDGITIRLRNAFDDFCFKQWPFLLSRHHEIVAKLAYIGGCLIDS